MKDLYMKRTTFSANALITMGVLIASIGSAVAANAASTTNATPTTNTTTTTNATSPVAGGTTVGITATQELALGWSAKKQILGKTIYNEQKEKVGKIDDLIITPDNAVSYAIVGAGGFVGVGKHDVAIPVAQLKDQSGNIVLPGATKDSIKNLPEFKYAKK
ncbi:MAG: PRC-barrel domain-containing protein [Pseudomonadota bacterium]